MTTPITVPIPALQMDVISTVLDTATGRPVMKHRVVITVPATVFDVLTNMLTSEGPVEDAGRDEVLATLTATFSDGVQMDVKVVNSESGPWSEAVLFDKGGEIGCTEVSDQLGGEWIIKPNEDTTYTTMIERSSEYNDKLSPDDQIDTEEGIAAYLFNNYREGISEQEAAQAGRDLLRMILRRFRGDLFLEHSANEVPGEHDPETCGCEYKGNNCWSCGHIDQLPENSA